LVSSAAPVTFSVLDVAMVIWAALARLSMLPVVAVAGVQAGRVAPV
jgi:hypothetical protein